MMPPGRGLEGLADAVRTISISPPAPITGQWSLHHLPTSPYGPLMVTINSRVLIGRVALQDADFGEYGFVTFVTMGVHSEGPQTEQRM